MPVPLLLLSATICSIISISTTKNPLLELKTEIFESHKHWFISKTDPGEGIRNNIHQMIQWLSHINE